MLAPSDDPPYDLDAEMKRIAMLFLTISDDPRKLREALDKHPQKLANVVDAVEKLAIALDIDV